MVPALASAVEITDQPSSVFTPAGESASFSVTALNATGYQWTVHNGSSSIDISDGGIYSGATSPTLSISAATQDMNGYQYRVTVYGSPSGQMSDVATLHVSDARPVAGPVVITVAANSFAQRVPLDVTGSIQSVSIETAPAHGNAYVVGIPGTSIWYQPASGYSGSDSFTYSATNASGRSDVAMVTITVAEPTLIFQPPEGSLPNGTVGTAYSEAITVSGGTAPYQYRFSGRSLDWVPPPGLTVDPASGVISGTPTTPGNYDLVVTAFAANGETKRAVYSLTVSPPVPAPIANSINATFAANSTANAVTLNLTGGAATSVAVVAGPMRGTTSVSGTTITYTPPPGYSGPDSFDYTGTNASGTSSPGPVHIYVTAPILTFSPVDGGLAGGSVGTTYAETVTASAGMAPYSYAVTSGSLPVGLTLNPTTGEIAGTPTTAETANFIVTATDANYAIGSASYSIAVAEQLPVANDSIVTVPESSSLNMIPLNITGGMATSVTIISGAAHGATSVSGVSVSYTPIVSYSGLDSFTYTATNAAGTSAPATVTIAVSPTILTVSPSTLATGTVGTAYSQMVTASGGTAPYGYTVNSGTLPAGLTLNPTTGEISGTPATAGSFSFTVTAADARIATGSASYVLLVNPTTSLTFSPSGGALRDAMAGEEYSQLISASAGAAPLIYSLASGTLPDGMVLNVSTGALTGPLHANSDGAYSFTLQVQDGTGATGSASFTLQVRPRDVTVTDKEVEVPAGSTPSNINLTTGSTGGPFISADITFVEPPNAGTARIVNGEFAQVGGPAAPGWYLKFVPNPAYSGRVSVGFRLTSALGTSNTGTVTYTIGYDTAEVASDIYDLTSGFLQARQNLIASTIEVPGLLERRQLANATDLVTARMSPSSEGLTLDFSTSLAQMDAARSHVDGVANAELSPFNIWIDGTFMAHNREASGGKWGSFTMVSAGTDYLLSEKVLLGLSFHHDRVTDPTNAATMLAGNGWLAGPYASFEIGEGVFWDTNLLYGESANNIDTEFWDGAFDTRRWLFDTSITGQWGLDAVTTLAPKLKAVYLSETVNDYAVENSNGDVLDLRGSMEEQLRVSLGAEITREFALDNGLTLTPKLGGTFGFSGLGGDGAFGQISSGLSVGAGQSWAIDAGLLFNIEGNGDKSVGGKAAISGRF